MRGPQPFAQIRTDRGSDDNALWAFFEAVTEGPVVDKWNSYFDVYHRYNQITSQLRTSLSQDAIHLRLTWRARMPGHHDSFCMLQALQQVPGSQAQHAGDRCARLAALVEHAACSTVCIFSCDPTHCML